MLPNNTGNPLLSIVVLTYNGEHLLPECLESIDDDPSYLDPHQVEKIVIDNGSKMAVQDYPGWEVVHLPRNVGNIGGQNACFEHARGEYVLFVSNDVRMMPGCIPRLLKAATTMDALIQPNIHTTRGTHDNLGLRHIWPGYWVGMKPSARGGLLSVVPSIMYMMPKRLWRYLGEFDTTLPGAYEDVDMSLRCLKAGFPLGFIGEAHALHIGNATLQYDREDKWRFSRARKRVIRKHFKGVDKWLRLGAVTLLDGARGIW